jgi:hypothetical protein
MLGEGNWPRWFQEWNVGCGRVSEGAEQCWPYDFGAGSAIETDGEREPKRVEACLHSTSFSFQSIHFTLQTTGHLNRPRPETVIL